MDTTVLLWLLAAVLVLAGLLGLLLPALPGAPLLFGGLLVAAWAEDFAYVGAGTLTLLGILALLTYAVDFAATALGAKRFGASKRAIVGAALGALVGLFFGPLGIILGPILGAVGLELLQSHELGTSVRSGFGTIVGMLFGLAIKFSLAVVMVGLFLWWIWQS